MSRWVNSIMGNGVDVPATYRTTPFLHEVSGELHPAPSPSVVITVPTVSITVGTPKSCSTVVAVSTDAPTTQSREQ